jgi:hypothetical protein
MNCGLSPEMTDNRNNILKPPSLAYIYSPNHKTKEDIDNERHKENILESIKIASTKHKSDIERLNEREDEIFSNLYSINSRKTFTEIKEQRKKIENDYNIKTFSKQTLGVHGHELPKFSENEKLKYFWKNKTNYCENPKYKSQRKYLESIKYYKPPGEELYLNEKCEEETKWIDPFKKEYHPISEIKKKDLITNLNEINIFNNFDPKVNKEIEYNPKSKHTYRWSTNVYKFAPNKFKKGRYFEVLPEKRGNLSEDKDTFDNIEGFTSNYLKNKNKVVNKNIQGKIKQDENVNKVENLKQMKDLLFYKFSTNKEQSKAISLNKNITLKTQGF